MLWTSYGSCPHRKGLIDVSDVSAKVSPKTPVREALARETMLTVFFR
jgi:hypothetical protein